MALTLTRDIMKSIAFVLQITLLFGCTTSGTVLPDREVPDVDGIHPPKLLSAGDVEYPELAQKLLVQGVVNVAVLVSREGTADSVRIVSREFNYQAIQSASGELKPVADIFDPLAIKFIRTIVYRPAVKDGHPVAVWVLQPVRWMLPK